MTAYLSMPCVACSTQVKRPEDLCGHDDPLCPDCCDREHDIGDELLMRARSTWGQGRWAS